MHPWSTLYIANEYAFKILKQKLASLCPTYTRTHNNVREEERNSKNDISYFGHKTDCCHVMSCEQKFNRFWKWTTFYFCTAHSFECPSKMKKKTKRKEMYWIWMVGVLNCRTSTTCLYFISTLYSFVVDKF